MSSPKDFQPCNELEQAKKLEFSINPTIEEDMKTAAGIIDKWVLCNVMYCVFT